VNAPRVFIFQEDVDRPGNPHPGISTLDIVAEQEFFRVVAGMTQGAITVLFDKQFGEAPAF